MPAVGHINIDKPEDYEGIPLDNMRLPIVNTKGDILVEEIIIDLSKPIDMTYMPAVITHFFLRLFPNATILLVGINEDQRLEKSLDDIKKLAGMLPPLPIMIQGSNEAYITVDSFDIVFSEQHGLTIRPIVKKRLDDKIALMTEPLLKASFEQLLTAVTGTKKSVQPFLMAEMFLLLQALDDPKQTNKLAAIERFYDNTRDNSNYAVFYQSETHKSMLAACARFVCELLFYAVLGGICGALGGALGFLIAGPGVGLACAIACSTVIPMMVGMPEVSSVNEKLANLFTSPFSFFKTSLGKAIDHVVIQAKQEASEKAPASEKVGLQDLVAFPVLQPV